ncbi:glutaminyl-tRNA synthetase [Solidesulfovibrio carbinoliphilus subsp. oakridgensis]|uniref:Glutamine--tRNA ligase n=1 Tax=Solidesulfovibrio carbinoliphilus subsp. oakridgensis TaxID=694327 RepID=G7QAB6_9BACT|nr:glutamine--tRNA ligase/YqeY domain fusion protein [Solidesulfovibrio carbinoliphilus]EHJ48267.1 glutaminyl-tRNA synthetase [Solidesulfovibrio carbinoliphilus subsp. oakridgensis]
MTAPDADEKDKSGPAVARDFIRQIIDEDMKTGKWGGRVHTRFPPEPNGYLHLGHAKSICLNFGLARDFAGQCNLRFDDTNPAKEEVEYVDAIEDDVRWLGFDWDDRLFYASDYFGKLYGFAETLIEKGLAYVDDLSQEEIRAYRGTLTEPGRDSPYRDRTPAENLDLFRRMRAGEFPDGAKVLRAKIDMKSPNVVLRDPVLYRIKHVTHHRTGDTWCIYPMYDYTHCVSDALEGVTHSICSLEFENNRPLYDWVLNNLPVPGHPQQIEFARLNLSYTVLSKRKLIQLVTEGVVSGWDDPRLPTLRGVRRRGYTPEAIRDFCERIGISKAENMVDMALLEHCLREDLNRRAKRVMAVLRPLKVVIENYPEGQTEAIEFPYHPEDPAMGSRQVPFGRELYIERDDFMETPAKKWFRLAPGAEVRLRYAYYVTCTEVIKDPATGEVVELRCTHDPATKGGWSEDGRKVRGTLHWVSAAHALPAEVRLYDRLFTRENPSGGKGDFKESLNPDSLEVIENALIEPALASLPVGENVQFERLGYFCVDKDSTPDKRVFNRAVALKDSWARAAGR